MWVFHIWWDWFVHIAYYFTYGEIGLYIYHRLMHIWYVMLCIYGADMKCINDSTLHIRYDNVNTVICAVMIYYFIFSCYLFSICKFVVSFILNFIFLLYPCWLVIIFFVFLIVLSLWFLISWFWQYDCHVFFCEFLLF